MIDGYNCLMVKENDLNEWQQAIQIILEDKALENKIVNNAFNDLKSKYTWSKRAKLVVKNYLDIRKETI